MATASESKDDLETIVLAEVHRQLSEHKVYDVHILVTGRTGAGKSALVNSIVGEYVAEEGDSRYRETTNVTQYEKKVGDVTVTIYDSPGLQDGISDKTVEEQYLKDLEKNCREVDLNLYCVRMNERMCPSEGDAIVKLSRAFGMEKFWQNTLFMLTFANEFRLSINKSSDSSSLVGHFNKQMTEWKTLLQDVLINKAGITKEVAENVPIVPAGYSDEPFLPAANSDYWLSKLWFHCLDRRKDNAKPILKINWRRLRSGDEINHDVIKLQKFRSHLSDLSLRDTQPTFTRLQVLKSGSDGKRIKVIDMMAPKWLILGDLLEFETKTLENIEQKCGKIPNLCCREIFQCWINGEGVQPCSWEELIDLVEDCGEVVLAEDIKNALS